MLAARTRFEVVCLTAVLFVTSFLVGLMLFLPSIANAQAATAVPAPDFSQLLAQLVASIQTGSGWAIAGVVVSLMTWALRSGVLAKLPWPKAVTYLHAHPAVAMVTPYLLSAIGGIITTFASGQAFSWSALLMGVLKVGATAVATFVAAQKVQESVAFGAAQAAAAVPDKAAAAAGLAK